RGSYLMEWIMVKSIFVALTACVIACVGYDAHFGDCAINCTADSGCPNGLTCGSEGLCRAPETSTMTCTAIRADAGSDASPSSFASCVGLAARCGATGALPCCTIHPVPGGTFFRSNDLASDGMFPSMAYPATVSSFQLDTYLITVGRFRKFIDAGGGT